LVEEWGRRGRGVAVCSSASVVRLGQVFDWRFPRAQELVSAWPPTYPHDDPLPQLAEIAVVTLAVVVPEV
jgi:hypothetical protein